MATEIKSARDALEKIEKLAHCDLSNVYPKYRAEFDAKIGGIEQIAKAALALPRLNCEVGTEHEQHERFERYCDNFGRYSNGDPKCDGCQLCRRAVKEGGKCEFMWGQMPYEAEEGGEG